MAAALAMLALVAGPRLATGRPDPTPAPRQTTTPERDSGLPWSWPPTWPTPIGPNPDRLTLYDGYWHTGRWIPGMISLHSYFLPSPQYHWGTATFYHEGAMEATAEARGLSLEGFVDGVSLMTPADIGQVVWLRPGWADWDGPFLVVDCAQRDDIIRYVAYNREALEVGYQTAIRWGIVMPLRPWGGPMVTRQWLIDRVEVFKGLELPPAAVLQAHPAIELGPWWMARVDLEAYSDSPYWHPDPEPLQGADGGWILYEGGERMVLYDFPMPEQIWPPVDMGPD